MATYNLAFLKKRLYQHHKDFKGFKEIDAERLRLVNEKVEDFKNFIKNKNFIYAINPSNEKYACALSFVIENHRLSYDEKILFLIKVFDPKLQIHSLSLEFKNITKEEIEAEESDYSRRQLVELKTKQKDAMFEYIKRQIGVCDSFLLLYEKFYIARFLTEEDLVFGVKEDYTRNLFNTFFNNEIDLQISDEDLDKIIKCAKDYVERYGIPTINDLAYQLTLQSKTIGVTNIKEKIIFMIYVLDKNFSIYQIYDNNCTWDEIKQECNQSLGFYDKNLVSAEIIYDKTYNKEHSLSMW